jgi:hypothetical protein
MTQVCKYQSVCNEFEAKAKGASVLATAWIVNWIVLIVLFGGLVMLGHEIRYNAESRMKQVDALMKLNNQQDAQLKRLSEALAATPKHVLPHVLKIEEMLQTGCGGVAEIKR